MASFTIPAFFARESRPGHHFNLRLTDARQDPNLINNFVSDTWVDLACQDTPFLGSSGQKTGTNHKADTKSRLWRRLLRRYQGFALFPSLPLELQDQIWEACIEPVTHTVLCLVELDQGENICSKTWLLESPGKKSERRTLPVPLFHICQRSRAVAQRYYRHLEPGAFFSPWIDTLRLSIISSTKIYRHPVAGAAGPRQQWHYEAISSNMGGPFFAGHAFFEERGDEGTGKNCSYSYHPFKHDWTSSYSDFLHEYSAPYVLSYITSSVLEEVRNLEVIFYYEPYASLENQKDLSHTATYFLQQDCPVLDLVGLRHLSLKIAVATYNRRQMPAAVEGKESWRALVSNITSSVSSSSDVEKERGLVHMQSIDVYKVCAVAREAFVLNRESNQFQFTRRLYDARRRIITRLGHRRNWRP